MRRFGWNVFWQPQEEQAERFCLTFFLLILFGAILIPVVPLWNIALRALAALVILHYGRRRLPGLLRWGIGIASILSVLLLLGMNLSMLVNKPGDYLRYLLSIGNESYPIYVSGWIVVYDSLMLAVMGWLALKNSPSRLACFVPAAFLLFAACYHAAPAKTVIAYANRPASVKYLEQLAGVQVESQKFRRFAPELYDMLEAPLSNFLKNAENLQAELLKKNSDEIYAYYDVKAVLETELGMMFVWNGWVLGALAGWVMVVAGGAFLPEMVRALIRGGVVIAGILVAQHALGDFSYIIEHPDFSSYLYRARASYYYHAPASLAVALSLMLALGRYSFAPGHSWKRWAVIAVMTLALWLNSTRAVNLGMVGGCFLLCSLQLWLKASRPVALATAGIMLLLGTQILYEKPDINAARAPETQAQQVQDVMQSSHSRMELLVQGIAQIKNHPWLGQGVGNIDIPLNGYILGGELKTYSSHAFLVDIGLAAGIPAMLLFSASIALCLLGLLYRCVRYGRSETFRPHASILCGVLTALTMWIIASVFFPQEGNLFLLTVFLLLAVAGHYVVALPHIHGHAYPVFTRRARLVSYGLLALCLAYCMALSASRILPVGEFITKHDGAIGTSNDDEIYTNSPPLRRLLQLALPVFKKSHTQVSLLKDDLETLPKDHSWVLWDPQYDSHYPAMLKKLGYDYSRGYGLYPSFHLPEQWQVVGRMQPSVSILRVGRYTRKIYLNELGKVAVNGQEWDNNALRGAMFTLYGRNVIRVQLHVPRQIDGLEINNLGQNRNTILRIETWDAHGVRQMSETGSLGPKANEVALPATPIQALAITVESTDVIQMKAQFLDGFYENIARGAAITDENAQPVHTVSDNRLTTVWRVKPGNTELTVDNSSHRYQLDAYRLVVAHQPDLGKIPTYRWELQGSDDQKEWTQLDSEPNIVFKPYPDNYRYFYLPKPVRFSYYRIRFHSPSDTDPMPVMAMSEWELLSKEPPR